MRYYNCYVSYSSQVKPEAWNAQNLKIRCKNCNQEFKTNKSQIKNGRKYCSKSCAITTLSNSSTSTTIIKLLNEGKTVDEVSKIVNKSKSTIHSIVNKRKYRFRKSGLSKSAITNKFKKGKCCLICGFNRTIDAAHIIPASKGGTMEESNLLPLCPNHHRLFDKKKLNIEEAEKLKERISNWGDYAC